MARFEAQRETHRRDMSEHRAEGDDVLSDVEPLHHSSLPLLTRSWPSSLSALSSSREVTARLYSSLQHSREQEVRGHAEDRQVSFTISSPDLTAVRMTAATPPLLSHGLKEKRDYVACTLDSSSPHGVIGSDLQEAESEAESEADRLSQEIDLHLQKSLNKSANLTAIQSLTGRGRRHIEEMEDVRTHLQSILRSTAAASDRHRQTQNLLDDSQGSDSTSHLLSAAVCLCGMDELFPRYAGLHVNTGSSVSELQVLRDSLERERSRRKVCEQQVASLQNKVLQVQQQFTLAVAADRKKDIMIEQLDKTLVKVVEGWRKHEQERSEELKLLQEEKHTAERTHHTHTEALSRAEQTLSHMEETLKKEQKHNQELQDTNKQLEQQVSDLRVCVEKLQRHEQKLISDVEREREKLHTLQTESHNTQTTLEQHIHNLQQQITHTSQQLERERCQVKQEVILREEVQSRNQQLQEDLEKIRRERDAERVERGLEQTRFESLKSQMEAEFRLSLEQQLNDQLSIIQEENNTHNTQLREQHRKQLLDLSARHERELQTHLDQIRTELQQKEIKLQHLTHDHQNKLSEMQQELVSMAASKKRLETQREELVSRLQGMMRSHWAEALRLLNNHEQMDSVFSPPLWEDSKLCCSPPDTQRTHTHLSAAQAVVLHLSRERESGRVTSTHGRSDSDVLNCSNSFTPLEPVLDHTNITALSDCSALWARPVFAEEGTSAERKMKEAQSNQNQEPNLNQSHCEQNQSRVTQNPDPNLIHSQYELKAPPIREEAPPKNTVSPFIEDRRSELQYYVSKLLHRSPGDPLEEPIRDQHPADSGPVTEPLRTHTTHLQETLQTFNRSDEGAVNTVRSKLEHKPDEKTERGASRVVQSRRSVGRRGGSQRVWR